jgi:hypothetical protein
MKQEDGQDQIELWSLRTFAGIVYAQLLRACNTSNVDARSKSLGWTHFILNRYIYIYVTLTSTLENIFLMSSFDIILRSSSGFK